MTDRLGSVVNGKKYYPYGEEPATTNQNRTKFATYFRDETTALDYAMNRYYGRTIGRFLTPDLYRSSAGLANPQSWNRYAYVLGDPVNFRDPSGLEAEGTYCDVYTDDPRCYPFKTCPDGSTVLQGAICPAVGYEGLPRESRVEARRNKALEASRAGLTFLQEKKN